MSADFPSFYLQRATREFAEDLDKIRLADDFKPDSSIPFLVHALQQGAALYPDADRARVMAPPEAIAAASAKEEDDPAAPSAVEEDAKPRKEAKEKKKKRKSEGRA